MEHLSLVHSVDQVNSIQVPSQETTDIMRRVLPGNPFTNEPDAPFYTMLAVDNMSRSLRIARGILQTMPSVGYDNLDTVRTVVGAQINNYEEMRASLLPSVGSIEPEQAHQLYWDAIKRLVGKMVNPRTSIEAQAEYAFDINRYTEESNSLSHLAYDRTAEA